MDRISELPDFLIQHILSFLPTKFIVSTTVLSKRWKNLWIHVPILDFGDSKEYVSDDEGKTKRFMDFVDRLLILRNMSTIHKFCFVCDRENCHFDPVRVMEWIATAIKCKVEEVILSMGCPADMLPDSLFTSESLIKLDIYFPDDTVYYEAMLSFPKSISFPRLRILRLSGIVFLDEISVQQLFSSCPLLEDLCLADCFWNKINLLRISAPALKHFTLINIFMPSSMKSLDLKINAPNLMSIKYCDWLPMDLVVDNSPSLVHVDLCFKNTFDNNSDFDLLSKFISKLSGVQRLQLSSYYGRKKQILGLVNVIPARVPTFENIHLETEFLHADTMLKFLQFTPNLESLVIVGGLPRNTVNENAITLNIVPRCLLLHLTTIKVRKFEGVPEELKLVKYFLENARILELLILESGFTSKSVPGFEKNDEIMELDLMYPRASTSCKVKFQFPK
ncbi:hypothetical protein MKW92_042687 [Papaver armeniacum]|nr:hypothetical protein MKW92_042687 [Papaver armeniacum]